MSATQKKEESGAASSTSMVAEVQGLMEGLIEALADKHSQLDLNFQRVTLRAPGMQQIGVELDGTITLSVHMRELSEQEKQALSAKNVAAISK